MRQVPVLYFRHDGVPPKAIPQQKGCVIRGGHPHFFTKAAVRQAADNIAAIAKLHLPKEWKPLTGALCVSLRLVWAYRKTEKRGIVKSGVEIPNTSRPDVDNICKNYLDAFTVAGLWADDACVTSLWVEKRWGPTPYWEVSVEKLVPDVPASGPSFAQEREEGAGRGSVAVVRVKRNREQNKTFYQNTLGFGQEETHR